MCFILNSQYDLSVNPYQNAKKTGLKSRISQIQHDLRANSSQNAGKLDYNQEFLIFSTI